MDKFHSILPTWGGNHELHDIQSNSNKPNYPLSPKENIEIIERWMHEMTTFMQTLPQFLINDNSTMMFKKLINLDREYLKRTYLITSSQCDLIYRLLYVYSTGFFDNIAQWLKKTKMDNYDDRLDYISRLYTKMLQNIAKKHYKIQLNMIDKATIMQLQQYQLDEQRIIDQLKYDKHKYSIKIGDKRKQFDKILIQIDSFKNKIIKIKQNEYNYDCMLKDYNAVIKTQQTELDNFQLAINNLKSEYIQLKEKQSQLSVVIPVDQQNHNVLCNVLKNSKQEIEELTEKLQDWIKNVGKIRTDHDMMVQDKYNVETEIFNQETINKQERSKKDKLLQHIKELGGMVNNANQMINQLESNVEKVRYEIVQRQSKLEELKQQQANVNKNQNNIKYEIIRIKDEIFGIESEIENSNDKIKTTKQKIAKTDENKRDHQQNSNNMKRQKRLKELAIDKLKMQYDELMNQLNHFKKQNQIKKAQFDLSKKKLEKNELTLDEINEEKDQLNDQLIARKLKHQQCLVLMNKQKQKLDAQNSVFENEERAFAHSMQYQLTLESNFNLRLKSLEVKLSQKEQSKQDKIEAITDMKEALIVTKRKSEAMQLQINAVLQQISKRKQKIWRLTAIKQAKYTKLQAMKKQTRSNTDTVDYIINSINTMKNKYYSDLNELSGKFLTLQKSHVQKKKQVQRIQSVMDSMNEQHRKRIQVLQTEFDNKVKMLKDKKKQQDERKKILVQQINIYHRQIENLEKQLENVNAKLDQDNETINSYKEKNDLLNNKLILNISPSSIEEKKNEIAELEKQIKQHIVKLQKIKQKQVVNATKVVYEHKAIQTSLSLINITNDNRSTPTKPKSEVPTPKGTISPSPSSFIDSTPESTNNEAGLGLYYIPMYSPEKTQEIDNDDIINDSTNDLLNDESNVSRTDDDINGAIQPPQRQLITEIKPDEFISMRRAAVQQALSMTRKRSTSSNLAELSSSFKSISTHSTMTPTAEPPIIYVHKRKKKKQAPVKIKKKPTIPKSPKFQHKQRPKSARFNHVDWNKALLSLDESTDNTKEDTREPKVVRKNAKKHQRKISSKKLRKNVVRPKSSSVYAPKLAKFQFDT